MNESAAYYDEDEQRWEMETPRQLIALDIGPAELAACIANMEPRTLCSLMNRLGNAVFDINHSPKDGCNLLNNLKEVSESKNLTDNGRAIMEAIGYASDIDNYLP